MTAGDIHPEPQGGVWRDTLLWALAVVVLLGGVVYPLRRYAVEPAREALLGRHEPPGRRLALASQFAFDTAAGYSVRLVPGASNLELRDLPGQALTLILGGFRGPYVAWLWMKTEDDKHQRLHFDLIDRYMEIALLQSDYPQVWTNQAWNMAYNLSAQWQSPEQKYRWIRRAIEFLKEGYRRNPHSAEILAGIGWIYEDKFGRSQEAPYYRKRIEEDEGQDVFLTAYEWYNRARAASDQYGYDGHGLSQQAVFSQACHCATYYATEQTQAVYDAFQASAEARKAGRAAEADSQFRRGLEMLTPALDAWAWARNEWKNHALRFAYEGLSETSEEPPSRFYRESGQWIKELESLRSSIKPDNISDELAKIKRPEIL
jgi:hypothetical protein